jgi:outer membrane receptor protein involved in Fe transport
LTDPLVHQANQTVVGTANLLYQPVDRVSLVATVGRAFRSPNLVERFFSGLTPEGAAYQVPNPNLRPETSVNVDLGARYRSRLVYLEGFVFTNEIHDGIRIAATGDSLNGLPTYSDVNVDKLRYSGVELSADLTLPVGVYANGGFTHLAAKDVLDQTGSSGSSTACATMGTRRTRTCPARSGRVPLAPFSLRSPHTTSVGGSPCSGPDPTRNGWGLRSQISRTPCTRSSRT